MNELLMRNFFPIFEEALDAYIRQGVLGELLDHRQRDGGDVGADHGRFEEVDRIADRGDQDLRLDSVVLINGLDLPNKIHPDLRDVIQAPDEGADESRANLAD